MTSGKTAASWVNAAKAVAYPTRGKVFRYIKCTSLPIPFQMPANSKEM